MEKSFEINLKLERGSLVSNCWENRVTEYHCGIGWWFRVEIGKYGTLYIDLVCLEDIAQRFPLGYLVEADVEIWVALGDEQICIAEKSCKFTLRTFLIIKDTLKKGLKDIAHSDTICSARVKIRRTFGCRCDTLENFEKPKAFWTNQCLVVEGKKFHVNQRYLTQKSPIFKQLFLDNPSKEIIIDNTNHVAFEIFLQVVHKKSPAFPVQLVPEIIELAIHFEIGQVKEYAEWYIIEYGVWLLDRDLGTEHEIHDAVMKTMFQEYDLDAFLKKKQEIESIGGYLDYPDLRNSLDRDLRTSIQSRSTMEQNNRKAEFFVIPIELDVTPIKSIPESVTREFIIRGTKEHDFYGLHWTVHVRPQNCTCSLQCDELYWEHDDDADFHGAPPGWFITVDVEVFELIGDQKTLVGTKKNGTFASEVELVEVDLSSEFDWRSMPSEDAKFEVQDFSEEREGWTDACLVVQGRQFHINKMDLARNSAFFADIFNKKPGNVDWQFYLDKEDPDLFAMFLQIAHSGSWFIKKNDILGLADLAERYKSKVVMDTCKNSLMYYMNDYKEFHMDDVADPPLNEIMDEFDCTDMWEVKVEESSFDITTFDEDIVGRQGLNAMFPKLLDLKSEDLCWPIFIESISGEVYILKWELNSTLESLIETVANIENKPITSQQLMIDGVLVKNENDITANFHLPSAEKCEEITNVPDIYKDLIDGTAEELSPELRESFEKFLLDCSEIGMKKRILLADKYSFKHLLTKCFSEILRLDQFYQLLDCYPNLSLPVKQKIFKKAAEDLFNQKVMKTFQPPRFPKFYVEIDSEDTGVAVAARIGRIHGLPPCEEDVTYFDGMSGREKIWYNACEIQRIQSINTDDDEE